MTKSDEIRIVDFSKAPGGRQRANGEASGEEFREDILEPLFCSTSSDEEIVIDLDGVYGYATSFLDEAFGGLARKYGKDLVKRRLKFKSKDNPMIITEIMRYIEEAEG